jgi:hypothetical protein
MYVLDNVISEKHSEFIFQKCVDLKWTFVPDISLGNTSGKSTPGFSHSFYLHSDFNNIEPKTIKDTSYDWMAPVLLEAFDKLAVPYVLDDVFRCRARLTLPRPELSARDRIDNPHIDYRIQHWVLIYYVNSTDGDTLLLENNRIVEQVTPRRGRVLLFDGSRLHTSTTPTQAPRLIINTNIREKTHGNSIST